MLRVGLRRLNNIFAFASSKREQRIHELFGDIETASPQTILELDKTRSARSKQQAEHNQKVRNYHYYEYFRGEDFIENIPYSNQTQYTYRDSLAEQQEKERLSIEELQPISNHIERANLIREKINAYHDKQKKYEIEEFEKYLTLYPGTVKGPRPEDDWEAYQAYAMKKMPRVLVEELIQ
jgi:hypothetical protein